MVQEHLKTCHGGVISSPGTAIGAVHVCLQSKCKILGADVGRAWLLLVHITYRSYSLRDRVFESAVLNIRDKAEGPLVHFATRSRNTQLSSTSQLATTLLQFATCVLRSKYQFNSPLLEHDPSASASLCKPGNDTGPHAGTKLDRPVCVQEAQCPKSSHDPNGPCDTLLANAHRQRGCHPQAT